MDTDFKSQRDSICFLGLLTNMQKHFDPQLIAPDGMQTHTIGLNIHAAIIDNKSSRLLALKHNNIHEFNNPLLHAEQLTLKAATETLNRLEPRDNAMSVENYYRNKLFADNNSYDALRSGATLYTSLEPCPFCTAAILVARVKRVVFVTPDTVYGGSFYNLWPSYYKKNDTHYEQLSINILSDNKMIASAGLLLKKIFEKIKGMQNEPGTLYFDYLKDELKEAANQFSLIDVADFRGSDTEVENNLFLFKQFKALINT